MVSWTRSRSPFLQCSRNWRPAMMSSGPTLNVLCSIFWRSEMVIAFYNNFDGEQIHHSQTKFTRFLTPSTVITIWRIGHCVCQGFNQLLLNLDGVKHACAAAQLILLMFFGAIFSPTRILSIYTPQIFVSMPAIYGYDGKLGWAIMRHIGEAYTHKKIFFWDFLNGLWIPLPPTSFNTIFTGPICCFQWFFWESKVLHPFPHSKWAKWVKTVCIWFDIRSHIQSDLFLSTIYLQLTIPNLSLTYQRIIYLNY